MTEETNNNEVSLSFTLNETTLSLNVRSRAISAIDGLIGNLINIPSVVLKTYLDRIKTRSTRVQRIQDAATTRVETAILSGDEVDEEVVQLALSSNLIGIQNKVQIVRLVVNELSSSSTDFEDKVNDSDEDIDLDWLSHFDKFAQTASTERVQNLWARVLAGEIRKPGSFSLTSLRLLSELDQSMATAFEKEAEFRLDNARILKPNREDLQRKMKTHSLLEEVGLLQFVSPIGGQVINIPRNDNGEGILAEQDLGLTMKIHNDIALEVIPLTRSGREIAVILPPANAQEVLEKVAAAIYDKVESMEIRRIVWQDGDSIMTDPSPLRILK